MADTLTLHEECEGLAARYPLAVKNGGLRFVVISYGEKVYLLAFARLVTNLLDRDSKVRFDIRPETDATEAPDWVLDVLRQGTPIPRHNAMLAWRPQGAGSVAGFFMFHTDYADDNPKPSYDFVVNSEIDIDQLPAFRGRSIGQWFWDMVATGEVVQVNRLIASTPDTFWFVDAFSITYFEVAADMSSNDLVVPRGRYPSWHRIAEGAAIPPLDGPGFPVRSKLDLAGLFARHGWAA